MKEWMKISVRLFLLVVFVFLISFGLFKIFGSGINEEIINENMSESNLNLRIENALVEGESLIVDVKREQGFGAMKGVKFVISDGNSSMVFERFANIEELGSQQFAFNLSDLELGEITSIEIIPFVNSEEEIYNESVDMITSEEVDLGSGSRIFEVVEEVNETEEVVEESSSSSGGGGSSSSSGDDEPEESEINYTFFVSNKIALYEDVGYNKTPSEIRDYINNNFEVENITRDLILTASETFFNKKGTEQDLLRMAFQIFWPHSEYNSMLLVYEFENQSVNYSKYVLNFGGNNSNSDYFYFENNTLEFGNGTSSFWDLMSKENGRRNILIDRFGLFYEGDLRRYKNLTLNDVEWYNLEQ